jgi:Protein of unknown function (DUF2721)
MGNATTPPGPVAFIAAMVTPALLIPGATSLVASVLVRMGRVVDRVRALAAFPGQPARPNDLRRF